MNHSKKASSQLFKAHGNPTIIFDFHKITPPDNVIYNDGNRSSMDLSYFFWAEYSILLHDQKYTDDSPQNPCALSARTIFCVMFN